MKVVIVRRSSDYCRFLWLKNVCVDKILDIEVDERCMELKGMG